MIDKDKMTLFVTGMFLLLIMTTGLSYAYFSTSVKGNDNAKNVVVEAGTLKLTYTDGPAINAQNIKPGWTTTKTVSVKNNGTLDTNYNVIWQSLTNEITKDELVISATCQRLNGSGTAEGTCDSISQAPISDTTIAKKMAIESGITHKYTFTILFKEKNADQNYNQGKKFNGVLGIEESKTAFPVAFSTDSWETIAGNTSSDVYKVGDTKQVLIGNKPYTVRIANKSTPAECNRNDFSQTACGFVVEFVDILIEGQMNSTSTNVGGWLATEARTLANIDYINYLPSDLQSVITKTKVVSGHGSTSGEENFTSTDKLYLLSPKEIYTDFSGNDTAKDLTRTLDYYKNLGVTTSNYSGAIKKKGTITSEWWLRTPMKSTKNFMRVTASGNLITVEEPIMGIMKAFVSPAFRLG